MSLNHIAVSENELNRDNAEPISTQGQMQKLLAKHLPFWSGFILVAIVYLRTMAPTVFTLDSAEFATAAHVLGIVHSPGYVVYLLLAKLMTFLPVGDIAYRVNLLSAVFSLLTYVSLFALIRRLTDSRTVALAGSLSLIFSYYVWSSTVIAEVYTMQMWLFVIILFLCIAWEKNGRPGTLYLLAFVMGITAANNLTTVIWWPGIAWFLFRNRAFYSIQLLGTAIGFGILGLLPLLYLPLRSAANPVFINVGTFTDFGQFVPLDLTTMSGLGWYLSGQEFDTSFFAYDLSGALKETGIFIYHLLASFLAIGVPLGLWGLGRLYRENRPLLWGLLLATAPHLIFFINYNVVDKAVMFLPVYLVWTLFMAKGMESILDWLNDRSNPIFNRPIHKHANLTLLIFPLLLLLTNWSLVDASNATQFAEDGQLRLTAADEDAIFIARWGEAAVLSYFQIVEGVRTDVTVLNAPFISYEEKIVIIENSLAEGRTVYATYADETIVPSFDFIETEFGYLVVHQIDVTE